ncbi:uncharacterized protein BDZ99DRAFT_102491 [Mytilinidion resinicola]|uniref:Uncharacterized protein n=1 Tax=Mytilinidion resinicola TaxID=574789 RepID=A0A6A6YB35_9PEZI|nr:uncharacterized protein BDZ99DRAFT_102491 [Mytilinidion resinicola]KAF2806022.1 hypothetical protein BDZ99DRAFT_102491 [Mytilinidion resinicola]
MNAIVQTLYDFAGRVLFGLSDTAIDLRQTPWKKLIKMMEDTKKEVHALSTHGKTYAAAAAGTTLLAMLSGMAAQYGKAAGNRQYAGQPINVHEITIYIEDNNERTTTAADINITITQKL